MQINRDFYDGETYTLYSNNEPIVTCLSTTIYSRLQSNLEKYSSEWDKSICPWKINKDADFINPDFLLAWNNNGNWEIFDSPLLQERRKGYTFYLSYGTSNMQDRYDRNKYFANFLSAWYANLTYPDLDITDPVQLAWLESKYDRISPVIDFDYSRIFVIPTINNTLFNPNIEQSFDPTTIQSIGFSFYYKNQYGFGTELCMGAVLLNNKMELPEWSEYCTNSWKDPDMIDNGCFITPYWIKSATRYPLGSLGTRPNIPIMPYRSSSEQMIPAGVGSNFSTQSQATKEAAATINYFPNKAIYISAGHADIYDDYQEYNAGGTGWFTGGVRRYLKSSVTYAQLVDYLKTQCAYLGFRFLIDSTKINEPIDSQYYYIPEIDSKGVTTGNYAAANSPEAENFTNYTWTTDVYSVTPYDGTDDDEGGDPNEYDEDNETELNPNAHKSKNPFFNMYVVSPEQLRLLSKYMYSDMPTNANEDNFLTNNAIDVIVSLQMFPISLFELGTLSSIMLGKVEPSYWDATAQEQKTIPAYIIQRQVLTVDCGSCTYYPEFGVDDFRNYEPYCTAELELPYCGNVKIPTSVFLNRTLTVKYLIDLITGSCLALIFRDSLAYLAIQGQIGVSIPISGIQSQDLQANIQRKQTQYGESLINVARSMIGGAVQIGAATSAANVAGGMQATIGAAAGVASAFNQLEQTQYEIEHIQVPFTMHGAASPLTSFANEQTPRLIVKRPVMLPNYSPADYAHVVGFACNITAPLSEFSGLTVCATANLDGIAATEAEKQLIRRALLEGVIL